MTWQQGGWRCRSGHIDLQLSTEFSAHLRFLVKPPGIWRRGRLGNSLTWSWVVLQPGDHAGAVFQGAVDRAFVSDL